MTPKPIASAFLLLAASVLTTWLAQACVPSHRLAQDRPSVALAELLPIRIGPWTWDPRQGVVQAAPDVQAVLDRIYTEVLGRTYVDAKGNRVMLSMAYVADSARGTTVHRPEVCYPAQGFAVRDLRQDSVALAAGHLPVIRATMLRSSRSEPVTYWIVVGDKVAASPWQARWAQLGYTLQGTIPDALLVRVSTIDQDTPQAMSVHARFIEDLARELPGPLQRRLFASHLQGDPAGAGQP